MDFSLLALSIVFLIFVILGYVFLFPLIEVAINGSILYLIFLRAHTDITKRKKRDLYLTCTIFCTITLLITQNFLPLWWITTLAILTITCTQIALFRKKILGTKNHKTTI